MNEGDIAPDFELQDHNGNTVSLGSFKGRKNVVLCFYPKNRIFGCPSRKVFKTAQSVIAAYPDIQNAGSVLFAVSIDTVDAQKRFVDEYSVPYPHLADPSKDVCKRYAGLNIAGMAKRTTFVIDTEGRIRRIFRTTNPDTHGREIVSALGQLG